MDLIQRSTDVYSQAKLEQRDQWLKKKVDVHRELRVREFGQVSSIITDEERS